MDSEILTLGVFGRNETEWKQVILRERPDVFIDTRARRGVRGAQYAFVNSKRLQSWLREMGIHYEHWIDLAPSPETRAQQHSADQRTGTAKRARKALSNEFREAYQNQVQPSLQERSADLDAYERPILFCVEQSASACHRSLAAAYFEGELGRTVRHL